ncbi:DNA mismatch repair endonuclease MutL [uncultured Limosilactobacillus sp.]|uniref:DNA mismatch repair endonuclease MutL n=1 Tax=uncultured Limosilactobacillus sp. TaxID=2837629 RepID=UPI0025D53288|nr:DNA mismatch repair endonuclease MutL [uncultured Limosilactobacillus sp.]
MGIIHQLNPVLADQISAGEVIERPASIVKELVENSLDARSTRIDVIAANAGLKSIRVIDNGVGIAADDVPRAFLRHATSKISSRRDLFAVATMGFRGEALPSIASVADVEMVTAVEHQPGVDYHLRGGQELSKRAAGARRGTDITVRDLFYNTPARLKYLKTPHTELSRIVDIVNRLALAHPEVAISFTHDQRELFRSAGNGNLPQVIAAIYGVKVGRQMIPLRAADDDFQVSGYLSLPDLTRASRQYITLTINHRYVRNFALTKAVTAGYRSKLMVGRYPVAVINVDLDPRLVDVNVHPAKREVRLSKEDQLTALIEAGVNRALSQANLVPDVGDEAANLLSKDETKVSEQQPQFNPTPAAPIHHQLLATNPADADATDSFVDHPVVIHQQQDLDNDDVQAFDQRYQHEELPGIFGDEEAHQQVVTPGPPVKTEQQSLGISDQGDQAADRFPQLEYIGQLHGTFLLAQASDGLYIVDQHAAQERINFERYRKEIADVSADQQTFLTPLVLTYPTAAALKIIDRLPLLHQVGLQLEQFGQNSFMLAAHPTWFVEGQEEATAREMISWVLRGEKLNLEQFRLKTAAMMSCKRAIKANHHLDEQQARALLAHLRQCQNPFNCPHGRPVTIHFTETDLEKMFKRIQDSHVPYADEFDEHGDN